MSDKGQSVIQTPSGGGAVGGLGEKFSPDLFTGTGNFSVPIAVPQGVNGFQPQLTLGYSTGSGNGPFGLGWGIGVPGVMRKTAKGVPTYSETDVFVLSGAEDLVEIGNFETIENGQTLNARQFRPRTEGLFARILYINDSQNDFWKVTSKDGLCSYYGTPFSKTNDTATISDPGDYKKVFAWKLSKTIDTFSNRIDYKYKQEQSLKKGEHVWDQSYLDRIEYVHYLDNNGEERALGQVHFEYEDRPDIYATYIQGFEVRTNWRCNKIITKTHPNDLNVAQSVQEYDFIYMDEVEGGSAPLNGVSVLESVQVSGINGSEIEAMPPLKFKYTNYRPGKQKFNRLIGDNLPLQGLSSPNLTTVSLFANGLPDILEVNGSIRYWRNLGGGNFDRPRAMREAPAGLTLENPNVQLVDANGDGRVDMLINDNGQAGYYSSKPGALWDSNSFVAYKHAPSFGLADPKMKMTDLTGNGITDVIYSGAKIACYFSDPIQGWNAHRTSNIEGYQGLVNIDFSDPRIRMNDMSGDGLQDIVFVDSGMVRYWPSVGYGDFLAPVQMKKAPRLPLNFDPKRIFLADVDGDGMTDFVYVDANKVTVWINRSGFAFSDPIEITGTPLMTDPSGISVIDILGSGTAGVLYSADVVTGNRPQWYFLDLTGGVKPYLLAEMNNNMGSLTRVEYQPSTFFYAEDEKKKNTRWKTPLPFPVQVVSKTEVVDQISKGKLSTVYKYRHGYWDGAEREFRGFGRVDTFDTESFESFNAITKPLSQSANGQELSAVTISEAGLVGFAPVGSSESESADVLAFNTVNQEHYSPPTTTRNWFNLGPVGGEFGDWTEMTFSEEYWQEDPNVLHRPTSTKQMLSTLPRRIQRDAMRTLRGNQLRSETYTFNQLQGPAARPFSVSENQQGIKLILEKENAGEAVIGRFGIVFRPPGTIFYPFSTSSRSSQWEEGNDPLTTFSFTGEYDEYGQPQLSASMALPRGITSPYTAPRGTDSTQPILATLSNTTYIHKNDQDTYICDRQCRALNYEIIQSSSVNVFELAANFFDL
jgi:hypothetical protein